MAKVKKENKYLREAQLIRALRDQHQVAWNESKKAQDLEVALAAELYVLWSTGGDEGDIYLNAQISGGALVVDDAISNGRVTLWTEYCHENNAVQYAVDGDEGEEPRGRYSNPAGAFVFIHEWFKGCRERKKSLQDLLSSGNTNNG